MTVLHEQLDTPLSRERAFAFVADFANADRWDPGTATSERVGDGPVGVGARYRLGVRAAGRVVPMDYVITSYEPNERVVLRGTGRGIQATDEIRFTDDPGGTRIAYTADIRLTGLLRPAGWLAGPALRRIGHEARAGMERTLNSLARDA